MTCKEVTDQYPVYLSEGAPRSKGTHLSGVIYCIAAEAGILKPEWVEEISLADARPVTDSTALLRMSIGIAWESHYIPLLKDVVDHPGECEVDGIYMTPDGESVTVMITVGKRGAAVHKLHECKATYKSINTAIHNGVLVDRMWLMQIMGYCKGKGARIVCMHMLFVNGDYSYPLRPKRIVLELEFTEAEIEENWQLMTDYRDYRTELEKTK